jgi:serine/threonine-protein kinase RsbW
MGAAGRRPDAAVLFTLAKPKEVMAEPVAFPPDIVIATDIAEAERVQQVILDELQNTPFSEREIFAIKLALEEALVNAMKHGNQFDPAKKVRIAYHFHEDTFYVRICDEGQGFNPEDVPDPTMDENLERPCGRGLLLMRHYMNEVEYVNGGTVVVMCKRCNGDAS